MVDGELAWQLQQAEDDSDKMVVTREDEPTAGHGGKGQWKKQHRSRQRKQASQAKSNVIIVTY